MRPDLEMPVAAITDKALLISRIEYRIGRVLARPDSRETNEQSLQRCLSELRRLRELS